MRKVLLISILAIAIIVLAFTARRQRSPRLALRRSMFWMLLGVLVSAIFVVFIYPRFLG